MRILYILSCLGFGGAEKQVISLAERMAAKGHTVAIVSLKHTERELPVKLPVLRLNLAKTPLGIWRGLRFTSNFLTLFRPDILHSHTFPANLFTRLLRIMLRTKGARPRVINTIHNVYEGGWHRMFLYRVTDPLVDQVTAVSTAAAEQFVHRLAVPARKMRVLTNGIDTEAFAPDRIRRRRVRSQMQAGNRFIWLAAGRLTPAKDYPNLLRAFALVHSTNPAARLWIAGEGDATQLMLDNRLPTAKSGVELLGLRSDIADLLDAADGFVLSSAWEGMPLVVGEALAMEKAVVATDVGGVRELVGDTGLLVPKQDHTALAAAMLEVMSIEEMARRLRGRDARRRIQLQFSMTERVVEWEQFYSQLNPGKSG